MADTDTAIDTSEFDKHFEELSKIGDASDSAKSDLVPVTEAAAPETPAETPPAEGEKPAEEGDATADAPADDDLGGEPPAPDDVPAEDEKAPKTDDTLKRFADYMERQEAARQEALAREEAARAQQEQPQPSQPLLATPEEIEKLTVFEKDWPEAAEAMQIALRVNTQTAIQSVFQTLEQYLGPKMHLLDLMANRMQFREMQEDFPQYNEEYREQLKAWALSDEHPPYLRAAHEHVIKEGSREDVEALIQSFERTRGTSQQAPKGDPKPRKTPELPTTTIQAARSMAPVSGKRSNPTVQVAPSSFEDAFDQFAKDEG